MGSVVSTARSLPRYWSFRKKGVVVLVSYGRTFNPVEHINPLMVLEGGKVRPCGVALGSALQPNRYWLNETGASTEYRGDGCELPLSQFV